MAQDKKPATPAKGRLGAGSTSGKLTTSQEIYDRIRWDPKLDRGKYTIGYDARERGFLEMSFTAFVPGGDIPWHRIWWFRCGSELVWDRRTRTDLLSTGQLTTSSVAPSSDRGRESPALAVDPEAGELTALPVYRYDAAATSWQPALAELPERAGNGADRPLVILTYNVLCDLHEADKLHSERRLPALLSVVRESDADLVALQEVTPTFLRALLAQPWVQRGYDVSDGPGGETIAPAGQVLLSRRPLRRLFSHRFSKRKAALIGEVVVDGSPVRVAVVHLTSNRSANAKPARAAQLWTVLDQLSMAVPDQAADYVVVGDFNAAEGELDELLAAYGVSDAWRTLKPDEPGFTFDPRHNSLAGMMTLTGQPGRYDRVLLSDSPGRLRPTGVRLLGQEPIAAGLHASDHYALCCTVKVLRDDHTHASTAAALTAPAVHRSAVVVIPAATIWPAIQAIRTQHDPSYRRWMPHINLLYGFLPDENFAAAAARFSQVLAGISPFTVTLRGFSTFSHAGSQTVWLEPVAEPEGSLKALQAALQAAFPSCDEQSTRSPDGYTPHLTVAQLGRDKAGLIAGASWQRGWQARSFQVTEIALISRRQEEPFAVRYRIALGSGEVFASDEVLPAAPSLISAAAVGPEVEQQHSAALQLLAQACTPIIYQSLPGEALRVGPVLHLLGSARLGASSPASDLDVFCVGPDSLPREEFFQRVGKALLPGGQLGRARLVPGAVVPVLELMLAGVAIDLAYVALPAAALDTASADDLLRTWQGERLDQLDPPSRLALLGAQDADVLLRHAEQTCGLTSFRQLVRTLSRWARARGVHGNAYGYLGGFSFAVLAAWAGEIYPGDAAAAAPEALLLNLFTTLADWDYQQAIGLSDTAPLAPLDAASKGQSPMVLLAPAGPSRNSARNVTRATLAVLKEEFARAQQVMRHPTDSATALFAPWTPAAAFPDQLRLSLRWEKEADGPACVGWLEGHFLALLLDLSRQRPVRPVPGLKSAKGKPRQGTLALYLGVPTDGGSPPDELRQLALTAAQRLIARFAAWPERPEAAELQPSYESASAVLTV